MNLAPVLKIRPRANFNGLKVGVVATIGAMNKLMHGIQVSSSEMPDRNNTLVFEESRPMLLGLAYRILGSRAAAEDAVQDTFLKWQKADGMRSKIPRHG